MYNHPIGAVIATKGFLNTTHEGIVYGTNGCGQMLVIENSKTKGQVSISTFEEFSEGNECWIVQPAPRGREVEIAHRATQFLGCGYDLWNFNCQHFVSEVYTGVRWSWELVERGFSPETF